MSDEFRFIIDDAARLGVDALPVRRREFSTGEQRISALVWGESEPATVYLHGAGLHAHSWDSVILASGSPAIAFDLPGHGESSWRDDFDYRPSTLAPDVTGALRASIGGPVALVGQSMGGLTAIEVARSLPGSVTHLALVDISPGRRPDRSGSRGAGGFMRGPDSYASRDEIVQRAMVFGTGTSAENLARGVELNTRVRADGRVEFKHHLAHPPAGVEFPSFDAREFWPVLEALRLPVLLAYGSRGHLGPADIDAPPARPRGLCRGARRRTQRAA
jgi:pimeloyl-ACP methyl ester carboxylesterase